MKPTMSDSEVDLIKVDQVDREGKPTGMVIVTKRTYRKPGTRSPIHIHPYGGQTCVFSGEMTLFLDGDKDNKVARAGECYWMPAGPRMSGVNTGIGEAVMFDTFIVPKDQCVWEVTEPGMKDAEKQFGCSSSMLVEHPH